MSVMLRRFRRLPSPATVISFVALLAVLGTGSAVALSGSNSVKADDIAANAVGAADIRTNSIHRGEMFDNAVASSEVAANSLTGSDINEATLNISSGGGGGGGSLTPFTATLSANQTREQTLGNFTVTTSTNAAGTCGIIQLRSADLDSQISVEAAGFANLAPNSTANITAANNAVHFTAVTDNGSGFISGVVGRAQQGTTCLITGYLTS
jgi:hypothetical protein